jgi:hypothetical protein
MKSVMSGTKVLQVKTLDYDEPNSFMSLGRLTDDKMTCVLNKNQKN